MIRHCYMLITVLVVALVPAHSAGQDAPQKEEKPPLSYSISADKLRLCMDEEPYVRLTARLTNNSPQRVVFDPGGLWYQVTFTAATKPAAAAPPVPGSAPAERTMSTTARKWIPSPNQPHRTRTLNPGRTYRDTAYQLLLAEFFDRPGIYRMKLTYGPYTVGGKPAPGVYQGPVDSNELILTLVDCKK